MIETELSAPQIDPASLIFEVTETAAIAHMALAREFAERLKALGCRFALDDFGAGFGGFFYLKHIPFDYLKIDREFVTDCRNNRTDQLVIEALVSLARGLNKQTIAEGVEDHETELFLRRHGVDLAQGYHIGRPAADRRRRPALVRLSAQSAGQAVRVGVVHGLGAVARVDLREHVVDVRLHGRLADEQLRRDLPVRQSARDQRQHLCLARRQVVRQRCRRLGALGPPPAPSPWDAAAGVAPAVARASSCCCTTGSSSV